MILTQFELSYLLADPSLTETSMKECIELAALTFVGLVSKEDNIGKVEQGTCFKVMWNVKKDGGKLAEQTLYVACTMPRQATEWVEKMQSLITATTTPTTTTTTTTTTATTGRAAVVVPSPTVAPMPTAPKLSSRGGGSVSVPPLPPRRPTAQGGGAVVSDDEDDCNSDSSDDYENFSTTFGPKVVDDGSAPPSLPARSNAPGPAGGTDLFTDSDDSASDYEVMDKGASSSPASPAGQDEESIYASNAMEAAVQQKEYASIYEAIYGATVDEIELYERVVETRRAASPYDAIKPVDPLKDLATQRIVKLFDAIEAIATHYGGDLVPKQSSTCRSELERAYDHAMSFATRAVKPTLKAGRTASKRLPDSLTQEDIAVLHLYTKPTQLYRRLNAALGGYDGAANYANVRHFMPYIKLLITAMQKLPKEEIRVYVHERCGAARTHRLCATRSTCASVLCQQLECTSRRSFGAPPREPAFPTAPAGLLTEHTLPGPVHHNQ